MHVMRMDSEHVFIHNYPSEFVLLHDIVSFMASIHNRFFSFPKSSVATAARSEQYHCSIACLVWALHTCEYAWHNFVYRESNLATTKYLVAIITVV